MQELINYHVNGETLLYQLPFPQSCAGQVSARKQVKMAGVNS